MKFVVAFVICLLAPMAWSCATCFGDADSAQTQGMNMGIVTLLGVTGVVVGSMAVVTGMILLRMRRISAEATAECDEPPAELKADLS